MANRNSQTVRETLREGGTPNARNSQTVREVLREGGNPHARNSQTVREVLREGGNPHARNSQTVREVLVAVGANSGAARNSQTVREVLFVPAPVAVGFECDFNFSHVIFLGGVAGGTPPSGLFGASMQFGAVFIAPVSGAFEADSAMSFSVVAAPSTTTISNKGSSTPSVPKNRAFL